MSRINKSPDAIICKPKSVKLEGEITIEAGTIIHPSAYVSGGKVIIGENNIIEEKVRLVAVGNTTVNIGNANHIEVGATISGQIGNGNVIEHKAIIEAGAVVGNGCLIGIGMVVKSGETIADNTALWGALKNVRQLKSTSAEDNEQQILPKIKLLKDQFSKEYEREKLKKEKAKAKVNKM